MAMRGLDHIGDAFLVFTVFALDCHLVLAGRQVVYVFGQGDIADLKPEFTVDLLDRLGLLLFGRFGRFHCPLAGCQQHRRRKHHGGKKGFFHHTFSGLKGYGVP